MVAQLVPAARCETDAEVRAKTEAAERKVLFGGRLFEPLGDTVGEVESEGEHTGCFSGGVAVHHALATSALFLAALVHACGDLR